MAFMSSTLHAHSAPLYALDKGGHEFIRLAYSWEPPERNYEGAKLIAQAIKAAR